MNFMLIFIISNIINVTLSTIKSIVTVKGGKFSAACINALTYGFYTIIIYLTAQDNEGLSLLAKSLIIGATNLICVYLVKLVEEKKRATKLWKVESSINVENKDNVIVMLTKTQIPFNYIEGIGKYVIFNIFCATQEQSKAVKEILTAYNAKYFVSESKDF